MAKANTNTQIGIFVLNNQAEYPWTVYVFTPNPNGGKKIKTKLKVRFKHVDKARRRELLDEFKRMMEEAAKVTANPQTDDEVETIKKVDDFQRMLLMEALTWFECVDAQGNPVEPNDAGKNALLDNSWATDAIQGAYTKSLRGRDDEGN